jgi:hypothetical protein
MTNYLNILLQTPDQETEGIVILVIICVLVLGLIVWGKLEESSERKQINTKKQAITNSRSKDEWLRKNTGAIPAYARGLNVFMKDRDALLERLIEWGDPDYIWKPLIVEVRQTNPELALRAEELIRSKKEKYNPDLNQNNEYVQTTLNFKDKKENRKRTISQRVKDQVWNRDGGKCVEYGSNEHLEFDHIIPFSKGGANTYRNIQLLCEHCNRSKSDKIG